MSGRTLNVAACQWRGFWRQVGLWPLVLFALYWLVVRPPVLPGMPAGAALLEHVGRYLEALLLAVLLFCVLLGLQRGHLERERRISMHNDSLPLRSLESFAGRWLALVAWGLLIYLVAVLAYLPAFLVLHGQTWAGVRFARDARPCLVNMEAVAGAYRIEAPRPFGPGETVSLFGDLVTPDGLSAGTAHWIDARWTDGGREEAVRLHLLGRRRTVVPRPAGLGDGAVLRVPVVVAAGGERLALALREARVHQSGLSRHGALANLILSQMVVVVVVAGAASALAMLISFETGVFILASLFTLQFLFHALGPDAISSVLHQDFGEAGRTTFWWERILAGWTRCTAFVESAFRWSAREDRAELFRRAEWVAAPLSAGRDYVILLALAALAPFVAVGPRRA